MAKKAKKTAAKKVRAKFRFEVGKDYRITFRNGHSGEYHGAALVNGLPFSEEQIADVAEMPRAEEE